MSDMQLGGNILLKDFDTLPSDERYICLKIIGQYVREFECFDDYKSTHIILEDDVVTVTLFRDRKHSGSCGDDNLFCALDGALRSVKNG